MLKSKLVVPAIELLGIGSLTAVGLAVGGPIGAGVMGAIGLNLSSNLLEGAKTQLKEKWLNSEHGALNHDIQQALVRAFVKALNYLESEYVKTDDAKQLPRDQKKAIRRLCKMLRDEALKMFVEADDHAISSDDLRSFLAQEPSSAHDQLWDRIGKSELFQDSPDDFKIFLKDKLFDQVVAQFGEELKLDNKESSRAWRAFKRLLLEEIHAGVEDVQASQTAFADAIDAGFDEFRKLKGVAVVVGRIEQTVTRVEAQLSDVAADVKSLLPEETQTGGTLKTTFPKHVREAINRGVDKLNEGYFVQAKTEFELALGLAEQSEQVLAIIEAREHLARVLIHIDGELGTAKALLQSCLELLADDDNDDARAGVLQGLAEVHERDGEFELSESLQRRSLELREKIGDKFGSAETLVQLAWTVGRRGRTDEALELNRKAYDVLVQLLHEVKQDDEAKLEYVHSLLGNLFYQRAKVHQRRAEPDEAQKALESALEWQGKAPENHEHAKLLCELAELKFFKQEWNEGARLLEEASVIYRERNMLPELVECLHLMGRACATIGNLKGAEQYLSMASREAAQCGRNQKAAEVLLSLAYLARELRDNAVARERFDAAISASSDGEFQAKCLMELSRLAANEGRDNDRSKLVQQAIDTLKAELDKPKSEMDFAHVHFTLGWYSREIGHLEEALKYVRKARQCFQSANHASGVAEAAYESAGLLDELGRKEEAREVCLEVQRMIEGKPFFDIEAGVHLSLASFAHHEKNFSEAERLIDHAIEICKQHDLPLLRDALLLKDTVEADKRIGTEATATIPEMLAFLYHELSLGPPNRDGYLRLWAFCHWTRIESALCGTLGPNIAVLTDNLFSFREVSDFFKPYRDWSLLVTPEKYPENINEIIPFLGKMRIPLDGIAILAKQTAEGSGDKKSQIPSANDQSITAGPEVRASIQAAGGSRGLAVARYHMVSLEDGQENCDGARFGAQGLSLALPTIVHELFEKHDADELKANRLFFKYYNRGLADESDRLWYDLVMFRDHRCFTVYSDKLPQSPKVRVVASCPIPLPRIAAESIDGLKRPLRDVRKTMLGLLAADESSAAVKLSELVEATDDLAVEGGQFETIQTVFYALGFECEGKARTGVAIVVM